MNSILAETKKILREKNWWIMLAVGFGLSAITIVSLLAEYQDSIALGAATAQNAADDASRYWMSMHLPASWLGALIIANEFRSKEIERSVLFYGMNRSTLVATKFAAVLILGCIFGLFTSVFAASAPHVLLPLFDIQTSAIEINWPIVQGLFLVNLLAACWGFAIGLIVRNPIASILLISVQVLVVETYGASIVPSIGKYLLTRLMGSLYLDPSPLSIDMFPAFLLSICWVAVAMVLAWILMEKRDV